MSLQILNPCAFKVSWPETDEGCQPIKEKGRQGHSWQPLRNRVLLGKTLNFNGFSCHRSNSWAKSAVSRWLSQRCGQAWDWWKEVEGPQRPKWAFLANLQKRCNLWLNPFSPHQGAAPPCKGDLIAPNNRNQSQHGVPAWPTFVRWHLTIGQKRYCWYYGFAQGRLRWACLYTLKNDLCLSEFTVRGPELGVGAGVCASFPIAHHPALKSRKKRSLSVVKGCKNTVSVGISHIFSAFWA